METIEIKNGFGNVVCECSGRRNPDGSVEICHMDFSGDKLNLRDVCFRNVKFMHCVFSDFYNLVYSTFMNCEFVGCEFIVVKSLFCVFSDCVFEDCEFEDWSIFGGCLKNVNFKDCRERNTMVGHCELEGVVFGNESISDGVVEEWRRLK